MLCQHGTRCTGCERPSFSALATAMRCIVLAPLLCSVLFTLGHAAEEATTTAAPQGVEDPDKPTEYINGTAVSSWHDEEFKEFLRSGSMDKEEKVRHLLRVELTAHGNRARPSCWCRMA